MLRAAKASNMKKLLIFFGLFWAWALAQVEEGRLPYNTLPSHYDIDIIIVLEPDYYYEGTFSIDIDVTVGSEYDGVIYFHAQDITIDESTVALVDQDTGNPLNVCTRFFFKKKWHCKLTRLLTLPFLFICIDCQY